jgi:HlyD family secretion protein
MSRLSARLLRPAPPVNTAEEVHVSGMDRQISAPPRLRPRLLWAATILGVLVLAAVAYIRFGLTRTLAVDAGRLVIATVQNGSFAEFIPATALVAPRTTAYVDAIEGGQVAELLVEEGALVTRGQVLLKLQNTNLQLEVLGRQAQLMEQLDRLNSTILTFEQARLRHERDLIDVRAQVEQLTQRMERRQALLASGAVSKAELDELTIELARNHRLQESMLQAQQVDEKFRVEQVGQLRDAVKTTRENLTMAGETLRSLAVRAPISGQLTALNAELGEAKAPGQRIGQIDETGEYKVEAGVDEFYLGRVRVGQSASALMDGQERRLTVRKVYPQVRERQFKIDLAFEDAPPAGLRRGQSMQVRIAASAAREGIVAANGPHYDDTGGTWVFVMNESGTEARRRPVKFGRRNAEQIEVVSGLAAGDRIITSSYQPLRGFDRIRVRGATD